MFLNYDHLTGHFVQTSGRGRGFVIKLWHDLVEVQSGKGHICFTKPFFPKMACEILGWRFLKFWFFYVGFYCIPFPESFIMFIDT